MLEDCPRCKRRIKQSDRYFLRRYGVCEECVKIMRLGKHE